MINTFESKKLFILLLSCKMFGWRVQCTESGQYVIWYYRSDIAIALFSEGERDGNR